MLLNMCYYEKHNCKHLFSIADMKLNMMDFFFLCVNCNFHFCGCVVLETPV